MFIIYVFIDSFIHILLYNIFHSSPYVFNYLCISYQYSPKQCLHLRGSYMSSRNCFESPRFPVTELRPIGVKARGLSLGCGSPEFPMTELRPLGAEARASALDVDPQEKRIVWGPRAGIYVFCMNTQWQHIYQTLLIFV